MTPSAPIPPEPTPADSTRPAARPRSRAYTAADFPAAPDLQCDIVMKGGITSGVVYPLAVCELATTYRLRSVGGASAGAIAAAAAAAAEVGRRTVLAPTSAEVSAARAAAAAPAASAVPPASVSGNRLPPGFLGLAQFPELLTQTQPDGKSLLFTLFRPQKQARRLFGLLSAVLVQRTSLPAAPTLGQKAAAVLAVVGHAARKAPVRSLVGVAVGLVAVALGVVGLVSLPASASVLLVIALSVAIVLGVLGAVAGLAVALLTGILADLARLPGVGFGMSSGRGDDDTQVALTPWLYRRLQELAGRPDDKPLTFADLAAQELRLQMMTTNLSRAQPLVMPWNDDVFFFEPEEFTKLFGPVVVKAMVDHPPPLPVSPVARRLREVLLVHAGTKKPFPRAADLPIVVATRMSLSFPLLISAVPLYALDYSGANLAYVKVVRAWRRAHPDADLAAHAAAVRERPEFKVNWFSDGGLTSNLPVQFFDSVLPSRPTFAIDLAPFSDDHPRSEDERENSYLPTVNTGGGHRRTAVWKDKPLTALFSFGVALVETARTWVDEASLTMPGYRDRVVTVFQDGKEGGINLAMPPTLVKALSTRGRFAAEKLLDRFAGDGEGWPNHKWIRFRTATAALSDWLAAFERGYTVDTPPYYDPLLVDQERQPSYPISEQNLDASRERIAHLREEIGDWAQDPADALTDNRPQQPPVLRLVPRTDADS